MNATGRARGPRRTYEEFPKPKVGDRTRCGAVEGTLKRRVSAGCSDVLGDDGRWYRVRGLAEVALLVPKDSAR